MDESLKTTRGRGINGTVLKLIAVLLMTIDHIGAYCWSVPAVRPYIIDLRLIGRTAAPIFLFCLAEGLRHTRDKRRYFLRLYIASVVTGLLNFAAEAVLEQDFGNIFQTFAWTVFAVIAVERSVECAREKKWGKAAMALAVLAAAVFFSGVISAFLQIDFYRAEYIRPLLRSFICSPVEAEYSAGMIMLGAAWYFIPGKGARCLTLFALSLLCFFGLVPNWEGFAMFSGVQWAMAGAIPFILAYNGEKGRGMKWFFYIYYPCHVWLLALINHAYM